MQTFLILRQIGVHLHSPYSNALHPAPPISVELLYSVQFLTTVKLFAFAYSFWVARCVFISYPDAQYLPEHCTIPNPCPRDSPIRESVLTTMYWQCALRPMSKVL